MPKTPGSLASLALAVASFVPGVRFVEAQTLAVLMTYLGRPSNAVTIGVQ